MWPRDQESYNFVKGILSKESCHPKSQLSKFDAYIPYGSGYITFFCYVTSRDHMIQGTWMSSST